MRGSNHTGMRQFNERIVLQAFRHNGAIVGIVLAIIGAKLMTAGLEALV